MFPIKVVLTLFEVCDNRPGSIMFVTKKYYSRMKSIGKGREYNKNEKKNKLRAIRGQELGGGNFCIYIFFT